MFSFFCTRFDSFFFLAFFFCFLDLFLIHSATLRFYFLFLISHLKMLNRFTQLDFCLFTQLCFVFSFQLDFFYSPWFCVILLLFNAFLLFFGPCGPSNWNAFSKLTLALHPVICTSNRLGEPVLLVVNTRIYLHLGLQTLVFYFSTWFLLHLDLLFLFLWFGFGNPFYHRASVALWPRFL